MVKKIRARSIFRVSDSRSGVVLLEVILAVTLFVAAAVVIGTALNSSALSVERLRLRTHAVNLASSVLAEIQIGIRPQATVGPEPFAAPFDQWTCEIAVTPSEQQFAEGSKLQRIEIVVRHGTDGVVQRLSQLLPARPVEEPDLFAAHGSDAVTGGAP